MNKIPLPSIGFEAVTDIFRRLSNQGPQSITPSELKNLIATAMMAVISLNEMLKVLDTVDEDAPDKPGFTIDNKNCLVVLRAINIMKGGDVSVPDYDEEEEPS